MNSTLPRGSSFVSGHVAGGQIVLVRADGTTAAVPNMWVAKGTAVAGPGGTVTITLASEE